jgi:FkbM family methyltransferase
MDENRTLLENLSPSKRRLFELLVKERTAGSGISSDPRKNYEAEAREHCRENVRKVKDLLPPDAVVLDIGANMGLFTEELRVAHPCSSCHLFEPVREYFALLEQRFAGLPDVHCHNLALGNEDEAVKTIFRAPTGKLGWNTFLREDPGQPSGTIPDDMVPEDCRMTSLDTFCTIHGISTADLIKIDVEGYEGEVLRGALPFLARIERKPVLLIEVGWGVHHPRWRENEALYQSLFALGYQTVSFKKFTEDVVFIPC